jgi:hypothetical protein
MTRLYRLIALLGSITLVLAAVATSRAAATTVTFPLRGTRMATMAHGIAHVTQISAGDYRVVVTIENMPVPSTLKTTPIRHAYVAWALNASMMRRPAKGSSTGSHGKTTGRPMLGGLIPIALHATAAGAYTGSGTVMMKSAPAILVTAEVSAMVHTPAMPLWGVLIGNPMQQQ